MLPPLVRKNRPIFRNLSSTPTLTDEFTNMRQFFFVVYEHNLQFLKTKIKEINHQLSNLNLPSYTYPWLTDIDLCESTEILKDPLMLNNDHEERIQHWKQTEMDKDGIGSSINAPITASINRNSTLNYTSS